MGGVVASHEGHRERDLVVEFFTGKRARFDDATLAFDLDKSPRDVIPRGCYHLISKSRPRATEDDGEEPSLFLYRLSHPLGEYVVDGAKAVPTPAAEIVFDVSHHPVRVALVEALRGGGGYLTLTRLAIESYDREEHLLFSGFDDSGNSLDQETMEKLFGCEGQPIGERDVPPDTAKRLAANSELHVKATVSRSLEQNSKYFNEVREKLEKWADDMVLSAEKALLDTKEQIKVLRRQARQAVTLEEQHGIQEKLQKLERQQRRQRQEIFSAEDEIMEKRDSLINQLERRLSQRTEAEPLFTIRWRVI